MKKSTTRNTRQKIMILAAVSLLAAPALSLPTARAEQAATAASAPTSSRAATDAATTPNVAPPTAPSPQPVPSAEAATGSPASDTAPATSEAAVESSDIPTETAPSPATESEAKPAKPAPSGQTPKPNTSTPAAAPTTKPAPVAPAVTPAAPEPFYDIVKDPNRDAILALYNEGIVKPAKDRKFRPTAEIGRSDFSVILGRAMKANGNIFDVYFTDPIPDWAIRYVGGLSAAGIYDGYLDGDKFGPKLPVTRAEAAAMVARAAHLESQPLPEGLGGVRNIPVWALDDVGAAYAAGLIEVTNTGTLNPNKKVTRSEMAAMIAPLLEADAFMQPIKIEEDIIVP